MAAGGFLNVARFNATSSGTGDFVVSSAVTGYKTPADAGAVNATVYSYRAESTDLSEWEVGEGAYTTGTTTLARTTIHESSNTDAKVNFSAAPQVAVVALAGDLYVKGSSAATATVAGVVKRQRIAIVRDEKVSGTNGGDFTSGADRTRDLNAETDPDGIVSLASNQFTLQAGTWLIEWSAPAYKVDGHQTLLYNVTDTAEVKRGTVEFAFNTTESITRSSGRAIVTIAGAKAFEIRHRGTTTKATSGFGTQAGFGIEVYTEVLIMSYDQ